MIQAAKWLGVAPWDLAEQHPVWVTWALAFADAEARAAETRDRTGRGDRADA